MRLRSKKLGLPTLRGMLGEREVAARDLFGVGVAEDELLERLLRLEERLEPLLRDRELLELPLDDEPL